MISRCENSSVNGYHRYGGRGIAVCKKWRNSYEAFRDDMGDPPTLDHSLERHNGDDGYNPCNVYYAHKLIQANHTCANVFVDRCGIRLSIAQWARKTGISQSLIHARINRLGWSPEDAVSTQIGVRRKLRKPRKITMKGITKSIPEWAEIYGIPSTVIYNRLKSEWATIDAITTPVGGKRKNGA